MKRQGVCMSSNISQREDVERLHVSYRLAQEALDETQDRLRLAVEAGQLAMWEWDVAAGKVYLTERWGIMVGDSGSSFTSIDELFARVHPEDVERVRTAAMDALTGKTDRYVAEHRVRGDEGWVWIESRGMVTGRDELDRATRMIGTNADISERKDAQAQMQQARELAESTRRAKSEFVVKLGRHQRVILEGILERSRLLAAANSPGERTRYTDYIQHAAADLITLINDVTEYETVDTPKGVLEQKPLTLLPWLEETLEPYRMAARDKGVKTTLRVEGPMPEAVYADSMRLRMVLSNLLANAVKFTPRGEIELALVGRAAPEGRAFLRLEVSDTGIGIQPMQQALIFQPFSQGDPGIQQHYGGTGLGLALCERLVKAMGGRLKVTSLPGRGSIFAFDLDLEAVAAAPKPAATEAALRHPGFDGLRVLVAEDHAVSELLMRKLLGHLNCEVTTARNGRDAAYLWSRGGVDLILMDVEMPDVSGVEATQDIRRREAAGGLERTPIIAVTAHSTRGARERCIAAGMDSYIAKPVSLGTLAAVIEEALHARRAPKAAEERRSALDPAKLLERLGGDKAALAEIATTMREDLAVRMPGLQDAFERRDRKSAHLHAHALKGALDIMTASRAAQLAKGLETAARKQAWELFSRAMPMFDSELARVDSELADLLKAG